MKRRHDFSKIRTPRQAVAVTIGTALGAGLFPVAPGTMGSVVGVIVTLLTHDWSWPFRLLLLVIITVVGTWSAKVFDETMGTSDNQSIVVDEVVGVGITAFTATSVSPMLLMAFLLFRFFDVLKPFPVRQIDHWSKKQAHDSPGSWWGGFGVMADDIVAGFQGLVVILLLQKFRILPW